MTERAEGEIKYGSDDVAKAPAPHKQRNNVNRWVFFFCCFSLLLLVVVGWFTPVFTAVDT